MRRSFVKKSKIKACPKCIRKSEVVDDCPLCQVPLEPWPICEHNLAVGACPWCGIDDNEPLRQQP